MKRASGSTCSRSPGRQKKRQSSSKPSGAPSSCAVTFGRPPSGRKLVKAPSARSTASSSILPRSAASTIGTRWAGAVSSLKPVAVRSPSSAVRRNSSGLADLAQRPLEGDPVPAFDDPVRGGADAEHEAPAGGVGERRRLLGEQRRAALEDADDPGPEPRPLGPGGAQGQRREAVGPVRLAAPEVGVAGRLGALHVLLVVGQRTSRQAAASIPIAAMARPYSLRARWRWPELAQAKPDRNLALELVRVTEAAALAAARWVGRGDKIAADGAASTRCASCSTRSRWTASS